MKIEKTVNGNETVLKLIGSLDTLAASDFGEALKPLDRSAALRIDLSELEYIASSGIRLLVAAKLDFDAQNGRIVLCGLNPTVREVFAITGMDEEFTIE